MEAGGHHRCGPGSGDQVCEGEEEQVLDCEGGRDFAAVGSEHQEGDWVGLSKEIQIQVGLPGAGLPRPSSPMGELGVRGSGPAVAQMSAPAMKTRPDARMLGGPAGRSIPAILDCAAVTGENL